jgi:hypothetical protein
MECSLDPRRLLVLALTLVVSSASLCWTVSSKPAPELRVTHRSEATAGSQRAQVAEVYGNLPMSFEENRGQTDRRVKFLSREWLLVIPDFRRRGIRVEHGQ